MRKTLVIFLGFLAGAALPAAAQTCLGLPGFSTAPLQVSGRGSFTRGSSSLGAGLAYGHHSGAFAGLGAGTRSVEALNGSSLELAAHIGYALPVELPGRVQLCGVGGFNLEIGPRNTFNSGVDYSGRTASLGLALARSFTAGPRLEVAPMAALAFAVSRSKAESPAGATLFEIEDDYVLIQAGVGMIVGSAISIRPTVDFSVGLEGTSPGFGLTVGYNFGWDALRQ